MKEAIDAIARGFYCSNALGPVTPTGEEATSTLAEDYIQFEQGIFPGQPLGCILLVGVIG